MPIISTNEKRFEQDIETFLTSSSGGYKKGTAVYDAQLGLYVNAFIDFIKRTQPKEWVRFENQNAIDPVRKFCIAFNNACDSFGMLHVLRKGFKHRGITFKVCYFKPESNLNKTAREQYESNTCEVYRQWHYSTSNNNSVDMVLVVNGIPLFALELKNQYTGQTFENAMSQWMYDRDPREVCFQFNKRILSYFCVDHTDVMMSTKLAGKNTRFLPFNQGSNGAGNDGGKGNPTNPNGYPTSYLWEEILQKDSMMDIIQKFMNLEVKEEKTYDSQGNEIKNTKKTLIFPRYHQLDVVRKLIDNVKTNGAGKNYLIQHSAGSGKSNSIAWVAYRLASLFKDDKPVFSSVIIVTDRTVLDRQLQDTISSFDHTLGAVETIGDDKTSQHLKQAINDGVRIIVTTLQKFPVIYQEVDEAKGRCFAVIVDEAHSSQTGSSALKLKTALADKEEALKEYAEIEGIAEDEIDKNDRLVQEMIAHGKHKNLSFFAFTATPKAQTLEMFGEEHQDGSFHPFHVYSMRQAIEEGFILDVLQNYMTYKTCYRIAKTIEDNPELPASRTAKIIRKYQELHPYNISQKAAIIVETFIDTTKHKIGGKGKMMVVTSSRLAAVRYYHAVKDYIEKHGYNDIGVLTAFSGSVKDGIEEYTESSINVRKDGSHISEAQTKKEFHDNFNVLIVAEKYQTGFDEPLLHTMVVDKKLKGVKAVQTLSRLNRTCANKEDTFVLDFINKKDDILDAFQPFYQETALENEVNVDKLYALQQELANFRIYNINDIKRFCDEYYNSEKQDASAMGRMTSILKPIADTYNTKEVNDRYLFRRKMRSLIKWYNYISQVLRMFDKELHEEVVFCSYLIKLLPQDPKINIDLEGKLKLEYYKLVNTFKGKIILENIGGIYVDPKEKGGDGQDPKTPLDEIIKRVNEKYKGDFTDGDKVLITALRAKLLNDKKLLNSAKSSDYKIFSESIFPKAFSTAAMNSYMESKDTYKTLFEDKAKYETIMTVLAEMMFNELLNNSSH